MILRHWGVFPWCGGASTRCGSNKVWLDQVVAEQVRLPYLPRACPNPISRYGFLLAHDTKISVSYMGAQKWYSRGYLSTYMGAQICTESAFLGCLTPYFGRPWASNKPIDTKIWGSDTPGLSSLVPNGEPLPPLALASLKCCQRERRKWWQGYPVGHEFEENFGSFLIRRKTSVTGVGWGCNISSGIYLVLFRRIRGTLCDPSLSPFFSGQVVAFNSNQQQLSAKQQCRV